MHKIYSLCFTKKFGLCYWKKNNEILSDALQILSHSKYGNEFKKNLTPVPCITSTGKSPNTCAEVMTKWDLSHD